VDYSDTRASHVTRFARKFLVNELNNINKLFSAVVFFRYNLP